ncbi:MAG TPA: DMT family transporter [Dongiaceae bacterium]|nr:DMT family transporter [Dongiaceae bacterium]
MTSVVASQEPSAPRRGAILRGSGWALLAVAIWSGWMVVTRVAVTSTLSAEDLAALRFSSAGLLLLPVIWRRGFALDRLGWKGLALVALCAGVPYVLLASHGLALARAAEAGVLIPGTIPLFVGLLSLLVLRERLGRVPLIGLGLIVAGVAILTGPALVAAAGWQLFGYGICLFSALVWAVYTIAARRVALDAVHMTAIITVASAVWFLPLYLLLPQQGIWQADAQTLVVQAIYQGPLTGIVALLAYNRSIPLLGAARASAFTALLPLTTLLLAIPVLGEWPSLADAAGALLAAVGVLLATGVVRRQITL